MSIYGVIYFRQEGVLPGARRLPSSSNAAAMIDPDREAFSTAPHDEYAPVHMNDSSHQHDDDDDEMHGSAEGSSSAPYDPTSYSSGGGGGAGTAYTGATGMGRGAGRVVYAPPTVSDVGAGYRRYGAEDLEQGGYDGGEAGRVRFPAGNYD